MQITETLKHTFLFSGCDEITLNKIVNSSNIITNSYKRGDLIYSSTSKNALVGFVVSGRCDIVKSTGDNKQKILNTLNQYDSFGVLSIYSAEEYPTQIIASKNCEILSLLKDDFLEIVNSYSQISQNVINFLIDRIVFLNKKIDTFSGTRVENRLASFICLEVSRTGSLTFPFNCLKTSASINSGRASIYRAISSLESNGLIKFENNEINVIDLSGLERIK